MKANLKEQRKGSKDYFENHITIKLNTSNSTHLLHPKSTQSKHSNDTFKYFIELNKNPSLCALKNNSKLRKIITNLQMERNSFMLSSQKNPLTGQASYLIEKLVNFIKPKLTSEHYEDLKQYLSFEFSKLLASEKLIEREEKIYRNESLSSIKEILNNPNSRNPINSNYSKKNFERNSSPINLFKLKEKRMKNMSSNNSLKNIFPEGKIPSMVDKQYNTNTNTTNIPTNRTNETVKTFKSLKYSFDFNRKSVPSISTNISVSDYYLNKTKQLNNMKLLSPRIEESNTKQILAEEKKVGNISKQLKNNHLSISNKNNFRYVNSTNSNYSNSNLSNNIAFAEKTGKDLKKNISKRKPEKVSICINQCLSTTKILNNNLMNYLSHKKTTHKNKPKKTKQNMEMDKKKNNNLIPNYKSNESKTKIDKEIESVTIINKNKNPSYLSLQTKNSSKIQPTEISINLKDLSDTNYFLNEIERIIPKCKKTIERHSEKHSEKDISTKTEESNKKSSSVYNNNEYSSPNNSQFNTNNYNTLSDRQPILYTHPCHQKHNSVVDSKDYLREIKLNIDDNLKNLFNFSYENFYSNQKDNSDMLSNSEDEKNRYQRKHANESNFNEYQTEEVSNTNINNDIMYTNEISFDKADENLKNMVFRKK